MKKILLKVRVISKYATYGLLLQMFLFQTLFAQVIAVTGKVTTANNPEGLPGVTIVVKGTAQGTVSDTNGDYRVEIPNSESVLVFSSIGFESQEIAVGNRSVIDIALIEDVVALQEVVVVGYGTRRKSDVTGAVVSISEQELREMPAVTNPSQLLTGRAAGVDVTINSNKPGAAPTILIRGKRSFSAGNDPLFVIDGIPVSGEALNAINPNDIVSMDVLKDASSTAIYGSRGANGVILVTTRRGKPGQIRVNYNSNYGTQKIMRFPDLMNGVEFAEYKRNSRRSTNPIQYDDTDPQADEKLFHAIELESLQLGRDTDWWGLMIQDGYVHNQNLSVSGGTERGTYNFAFGFTDNKGIVKKQGFKRYNLRLNLDQQIGERVSVGVSSLGTYSKSTHEDVDRLSSAYAENPLGTPWVDQDESLGLELNNTPGDGNRTNPLIDLADEGGNPNVLNNKQSLKLFNSIYGEVEIIDGLKFRMNVGPELTFNQLGNFNASRSAANAGGPASARSENEFILATTWENILTYSTTLAESHRIDFTGLYSRQQRTAETFGSVVNGLPVKTFQYYNMGSATSFEDVSSDYQKWSIESWMARINYVFNDKYLLTLTGRSDGSSKFAEGNKWGFFPSVALAWNITNEDFFVTSDIISSLRLRVSYGATGNEGIDPYQTQGLLKRTSYLYGDVAAFGYSPSTIRNDELQWESTTSFNVGVDFDLIQGRVTGALEIYQSNTMDLLLPRLLPNTSGFGSILTNVGETKNTGVEFLVATKPVIPQTADGFSWDFDFNFASNKEEIVELSQGKVDDVGNLRFIGQPLNVFFNFERNGIWGDGEETAAIANNSQVGQIRVNDQDGDGVITPDDRIILGSDVPDFTGGITNRLSFKGFDLTIVAYARIGQEIEDRSWGSNRFASGRWNMQDLDFWLPSTNSSPNPDSFIPEPNTSLVSPLYGRTLEVFDGSFIKIRNINLGYNFPTGVIEKLGLQSLNLFVSVQNPFWFSKYVNKNFGLDPEFVTRLTPVARTYMVGLNINF